ncbi:ATP-binding protein [Teredinibacter sp. KSP-S5-2]|uniref:ATP-binding protein n=1 Tax=Teredinibacter sp. KSP-S5-2 TaxID=3034506 RepID=UPI002934E534|nr:ATP-binding protein [Teredinibacter sp. KSP-S5-2]WNO11473.1 ATP-binding protein [Teredinibacter sp. KSP-S5-2]
MDSIKILLIEDNLDHAELISDCCDTLFGKKLTLDVHNLLKTGMSALAEKHYDIVLADLQFPDSSLEDTIETLKNTASSIPIVVLTSLKDDDIGQTLVQAGIQDYLPKEELSPTLLHRICMYSIERKKQEVSLQRKTQDQQMFCRSLSHDFKGPIRKIRQLCDSLNFKLSQSIDFDEETTEHFNMIDRQASTMTELVDGLYQYLQVDMNNNTYEDIDLNDLVLDAWEFALQDKTKEPKLLLKKLPKLYGIRPYIFMLFQNLINNGIKYNQNPPVITISSTSNDEEITIQVQDNGIGIQERYFDVVFQPFERLHTRGSYSGSGLGLSIVKRVVDKHNGQIRIESQPGLGTTFFITLPIRKLTADANP